MPIVHIRLYTLKIIVANKQLITGIFVSLLLVITPVVIISLNKEAKVVSNKNQTSTKSNEQSSATSDSKTPTNTSNSKPAPSSTKPTSNTPKPSTAANVAPSTAPTVPSSSLSVKVSGNHLVDANGAVVRLLGVNRSGTQYACIEGWGFFDGPTDATALSKIKAWGINAVRVSLNEHCWLGINGVSATYSGTNYQTAIKDYVTRLNAAGLRVILDLHWNAPGTLQALDQQPMADRDHAPAFWQGVASAFKSNLSVVFDLYNEPYPDSNRNTTAAWTCVKLGGTCPGVTFVAAGSQELTNAIRSTGATNVIMVGGPQYAGDVDQWTAYKPSDPLSQLAASIHIYYNTPASPEWAPCYLLSCWNSIMAPLATTTPIVIGEVGEHDCAFGLISGTSLSPTQPSLLDWADQHGISYLGWSWIANNGVNCAAEPSLVMDYNGTPTAYGIGLRDHLLALPH